MPVKQFLGKTDYRPPATGYRLPTTGYRLPTTGYRPPTTDMNLAETILRKHQDAVFRIALQEVKSEGINTYSFGGLDYLSDKFATVLRESGIRQGDVVAVILPQSAAFAVAHLAVLKLGATVLPVSIDAKPSLIERMLAASRAKSLVIDESIQQNFLSLSRDAFQLNSIFVSGEYASQKDFGEGFRSFWYELNFADADSDIVETDAATPGYIFFESDADENLMTSSTTHGEILEACKNWASGDCSQKQKVFWTTHNWASKREVFEMLLKTWVQGDAIASYSREMFNEEDAVGLFKQLEYTQFKLNNDTMP